MQNDNARTISFPFFGILGIVFITLKLCNVIGWSWIWVLAPLWGPFAIAVAVIVLAGIFAGIATAIGALVAPKPKLRAV